MAYRRKKVIRGRRYPGWRLHPGLREGDSEVYIPVKLPWYFFGIPLPHSYEQNMVGLMRALKDSFLGLLIIIVLIAVSSAALFVVGFLLPIKIFRSIIGF